MIGPFNQVSAWDFVSQARAVGLGLELAMAEQPEWGDDIWLVTHMDLHKMTKVQAMIQHVKTWAKENWA